MPVLSSAIRIYKRNGLFALAAALQRHLQTWLQGVAFFFARKPGGLAPEALVDYATNHYQGLVRPMQVRAEIVDLLNLVRARKPMTVVEIGTMLGGTLFLLCRTAPQNATIVSIDLPGGIHGGGYPLWRKLLYKSFATFHQAIHLVRGSSRAPKTLEKLKRILRGRTIDFLFIDGDHTYEGVKTDFESYLRLMSKDGIVAFHDICKHPAPSDCHVHRFWNEIKRRHNFREFIDNTQQGWAGIGVLFLNEYN